MRLVLNEKWFLGTALFLWVSVVCNEVKDCYLMTANISPAGNIYRTVGDSVILNCTLNKTKIQKCKSSCSSLMYWTYNGVKIPSNTTIVFSPWTIGLNLPNLKLTEDHNRGDVIFCKFKNQVACGAVIRIGYPPSNLTDIKLEAIDLQHINISWIKPPRSSNDTRFTVNYRIMPNFLPETCNVTCFYNHCCCIVRELLPYSKYEFTIKESNHFGTWNSSPLIFDILENVKPSAPQNLGVSGISTTSLDIKWDDGCNHCEMYNVTMIHEVVYFPLLNPEEIKIFNFSHKSTDNLQLKNLRPYQSYNISIRTIVNFPSNYESIVLKTYPDIPDGIVSLDPGGYYGFSHGKNRTVRVFWQDLPEYVKNGPNLTYLITINGQNIADVKTSWVDVKLPEHYKLFIFKVTAKNTQGVAVHSTSIIIPSEDSAPKFSEEKVRVLITDVAHINWELPHLNSGDVLHDYTVFWCQNFPCEKDIHWKRVLGNKTSLTLDGQLSSSDFYISANFQHGSSGMKKVKCKRSKLDTLDSSSKVLKPIITTSSRAVNVSWSFLKVDCDALLIRTIETGLCNTSNNCIFKKNLNNKPKVVQFTDLEPYSQYFVIFRIILLNDEIINDTIHVWTQPESPISTFYSRQKNRMTRTASNPVSQPLEPLDSPHNLSVVNISANFIELKWNSPTLLNGKLSRYEIRGFGDIIRTNNTWIILPPTDPNNLYLEGNKTYNISVRACVMDIVECSFYVSTVVTTPVGAPVKIAEKPIVISLGSSQVQLNWEIPVPSNGYIDHYKIYYWSSSDDKVLEEKAYFTNMTLKINCTVKRKTKYYFQIAAVNVEKGKEFIGEKSDQSNNDFCESGSGLEITQIIIIIISTAVFLAIIFLFCFRFGDKMRKQIMMPVNVTLPDGIDNNELQSMITSKTTNYHILCCKCVCRKSRDRKSYKDGKNFEGKKLNNRTSKNCESDSLYHNHHSSKDSLYLSSGLIEPKDMNHELIFASSGPKYQNVLSDNIKNSVSLKSYSKINSSPSIHKDREPLYFPSNFKASYISQQCLAHGTQPDITTEMDNIGYLTTSTMSDSDDYKSLLDLVDMNITINDKLLNLPKSKEVTLSKPNFQNNDMFTGDLASPADATSINPSQITLKNFNDFQPKIINSLCIPKNNWLEFYTNQTLNTGGYLPPALNKTKIEHLQSEAHEKLSPNKISNNEIEISKLTVSPNIAQMACINTGYMPQILFHELSLGHIGPPSEEYSQVTFNQNEESATTNHKSISEDIKLQPYDIKSAKENYDFDNHYSRVSLNSLDENEKEPSDENLTNLIIENKLYSLNNILEGLPEQSEILKTPTIFAYQASRTIGRETEKYFSLPQSELKMTSCV